MKISLKFWGIIRLGKFHWEDLKTKVHKGLRQLSYLNPKRIKQQKYLIRKLNKLKRETSLLWNNMNSHGSRLLKISGDIWTRINIKHLCSRQQIRAIGCLKKSYMKKVIRKSRIIFKSTIKMSMRWTSYSRPEKTGKSLKNIKSNTPLDWNLGRRLTPRQLKPNSRHSMKSKVMLKLLVRLKTKDRIRMIKHWTSWKLWKVSNLNLKLVEVLE
jgi:hypothetical protein